MLSGSDSDNKIEQDGYTAAVNGSEAVRVLVATKAKPNQDPKSPLDREFFTSFLNVSLMNHLDSLQFSTKYQSAMITFHGCCYRF